MGLKKRLEDSLTALKQWDTKRLLVNRLLKETKNSVYKFGRKEFNRLPQWNKEKLISTYIYCLIHKADAQTQSYANLHFMLCSWSKQDMSKIAVKQWDTYWTREGQIKYNQKLVK